MRSPGYAGTGGCRSPTSPEARPVVDCRETAGSFIEWSNRQTAFSILGNRRNLYVGLVYYSANLLLLVSSIILSIFYSGWLAVLLLPFALYVAKSYQRSGRPDPLTAPVCLLLVFVYPYNMASSAFTREWSGAGGATH